MSRKLQLKFGVDDETLQMLCSAVRAKFHGEKCEYSVVTAKLNGENVSIEL